MKSYWGVDHGSEVSKAISPNAIRGAEIAAGTATASTLGYLGYKAVQGKRNARRDPNAKRPRLNFGNRK